MKAPSLGLLAPGVIGLTIVVLVAVGAPSGHVAPPPAPAPAVPPASVSAGGITLASASVDLPADDASYPAGPHVDVVNAHCTACHSAGMALNQPALAPDQWKAEVTKMREVYRAPVDEADVPAIVAYLAAMPGQQPSATGKAQDPAPKVRPRVTGA